MCEQCLAETITIGEVVPGIALVRATVDGNKMKKGQFGLVTSDDPFHIFGLIPRPDPVEGLSDEEINALDKAGSDAMMEWLEEASAFTEDLLLTPDMGWRLVLSCIQVGFDPNDSGLLGFWLFHRMGVLFQDWERKQ